VWNNQHNWIAIRILLKWRIKIQSLKLTGGLVFREISMVAEWGYRTGSQGSPREITVGSISALDAKTGKVVHKNLPIKWILSKIICKQIWLVWIGHSFD